jgi:HK97 family phage major capsid protein
MNISEFLGKATTVIPVSELTTIAADRAAFGDDVLAAFRSQIELRSTQATKVLETATAAGRDTLLASEQRSYDAAVRERDSILALQQAVERRTETRAHVPATQVIETRTDDASPVLTRSDKLTARVSRPAGITDRSFGRVLATHLFGRRRGIDLTGDEQRALSEGTDASGGFSVPEILAASFIDRLRDALVTQRAGAVIVPMTSDTLHMARLASAGTGSPASGPIAVWKVENDPIDEGSLTLERVTFTARTLPALIKLSVELSEDSVNIDQIIERELSRGLAAELDRVALSGSGTAPEPEGVENQDGVDVAAANAAISYDLLLDMIGAVKSANGNPTARIYNANAATALAKLRATPDGQYLIPPPDVAAVPALVTNAIEGSGSPGGATSVFVGDFANLMIGLRTSFRLESTRVGAGAFENLQVAVRAYLRADVQLAHPETFVVRTGVEVD